MLGWLFVKTERIQCFQIKSLMGLAVRLGGHGTIYGVNRHVLSKRLSGRSGILIIEVVFLSIWVLVLPKGGDLAL
jgi:hypothetical protein